MTAVTEHVVQGGTLTISPLQPTIGAEISGVDLTRPLSDAGRDPARADPDRRPAPVRRASAPAE